MYLPYVNLEFRYTFGEIDKIYFQVGEQFWIVLLVKKWTSLPKILEDNKKTFFSLTLFNSAWDTKFIIV